MSARAYRTAAFFGSLVAVGIFLTIIEGYMFITGLHHHDIGPLRLTIGECCRRHKNKVNNTHAIAKAFIISGASAIIV